MPSTAFKITIKHKKTNKTKEVNCVMSSACEVEDVLAHHKKHNTFGSEIELVSAREANPPKGDALSAAKAGTDLEVASEA